MQKTLGAWLWLRGVPVSPGPCAQPPSREGLWPNGSGVPWVTNNAGLGLPGAELWSRASGVEARRAVFTPCWHMFSEEGLKEKEYFSCKMKSKEWHSFLKNCISVRKSALLPTQRRFKTE